MRSIFMKLILTALIAAMIVPQALSADGGPAPTVGQLYPVDWLEGAYVTPIDRASLMDPGIAGMVRWLDAPAPSYPRYDVNPTVFREMIAPSAFAPYEEYYSRQAMPADSEVISNPVKFDIARSPPSYLHYGSGQGLAYSQYLLITSPQANDLWIRGARNWTQYLVSPVGVALELVGNVPSGGVGEFFESISNGTSIQKSRFYQFQPGYNSMKYRPDEVGRHMFYFVVNNQPSNVIVIDAFVQAPISQPSAYPAATGQSGQYIPAAPAARPSATTSAGNTPVSILYPAKSAFQVYVDGALVGIGYDGIYNLSLEGGKSHVISVWDGFWMFENSIYFEAGVPKEIYVEAV